MPPERFLTPAIARSTPYRCPYGHTTLPYVTRHRQYGREHVIRTCRVCKKDGVRAHTLGLSVRRYRQLLALGQVVRPDPECASCGDTKLSNGRPCPDCWEQQAA